MKKYLHLILIFIISCHKPYESVSVNLNVSQVTQLENWDIQAKNLITIWCPRIARVLDVEEYPHNIDLILQKSDEGIAYADSNAITVSSHWIEKYPGDIGLIVHLSARGRRLHFFGHGKTLPALAARIFFRQIGHCIFIPKMYIYK